MTLPVDAFAIGVGATLGALSRHHAGRVTAEWIGTEPNRLGQFAGWHTAGINIVGSFLLGGIAAIPVVPELPASNHTTSPSMQFEGLLTPRTRLFFGVGFCGSFTTFSTYSVDVVTWLAEGKTMRAMSYMAANNVGGIAAAACGMSLAKKIFR
ncbi:unnamed protein product [Cylindrotheca closterium]|uniref:Fluoride ion transporter CrcB n=1 Tax=Cylindrotheca closterium TaxID=2856 RepID=A0AAD2CN15_9STRA|nr:unnamed protein product [Cylindrotheca closterium]